MFRSVYQFAMCDLQHNTCVHLCVMQKQRKQLTLHVFHWWDPALFVSMETVSKSINMLKNVGNIWTVLFKRWVALNLLRTQSRLGLVVILFLPAFADLLTSPVHLHLTSPHLSSPFSHPSSSVPSPSISVTARRDWSSPVTRVSSRHVSLEMENSLTSVSQINSVIHSQRSTVTSSHLTCLLFFSSSPFYPSSFPLVYPSQPSILTS